MARYGPVVKLIDGKNIKFAPIKKPMTVDNITIDQAVELFSYPKLLGQYNNKDIRWLFEFWIRFDNIYMLE